MTEKRRKYLNDYQKMLRDRDKHLPCVYYLPEEHYVGVTENVRDRCRRHRGIGRITEGVEVLAYFERRIDAKWFEILLHQRGYLGAHEKY